MVQVDVGQCYRRDLLHAQPVQRLDDARRLARWPGVDDRYPLACDDVRAQHPGPAVERGVYHVDTP